MFGIGIRTCAIAILLLAIALQSSSAQDRSQDRTQASTQASTQERSQNPRHQPGKFDFYVLALSWSPSFCQDTEERGRSGGEQCATARPYSFVVHGLWPQYERGFPKDCEVPSPRLNRNIMTSMLDLMPAQRLVFHEWDTHGTCSGLGQQGYFDLVRKAREAVKIPAAYTAPKATMTVTPDEVEEAFVKTNPGLTRASIAVTCGSPRLGEVRICMSKDLKFRDCPDVDRRACSRDKLTMPPVRGS